MFARVVEGFQQMAAHAKTAGVTVLMESHGDFTQLEGHRSGPLRCRRPSVRGAVGRPPHVRRRPRSAGGTYAASASWVRHTHLKDSKADAGVADRRYVLTGAGEVPVKAQVQVLAKAGYTGYYCFEWEKKWHPEIEEPEVAFPHFARTIDGLPEGGRREAGLAARMQHFPTAAITDEFSTDDLDTALARHARRRHDRRGAARAVRAATSSTWRTTSSTRVRQAVEAPRHARAEHRVAAAQVRAARRVRRSTPRFQQDVFGSTYTFDDQPRLTRRAFEVAESTGAPIIRVFSYWRTVDPRARVRPGRRRAVATSPTRRRRAA